jgi:hypothetical protein
MELMNQVVEICGRDFTVLPAVELRPKFEESMAELSLVSDGRPFSNQSFHGLRRILHRSSIEGCLTFAFTRGRAWSHRRPSVQCGVSQPTGNGLSRNDVHCLNSATVALKKVVHEVAQYAMRSTRTSIYDSASRMLVSASHSMLSAPCRTSQRTKTTSTPTTA